MLSLHVVLVTIDTKVADPFPITTSFSQLRSTYFYATQYQSLINVDMSRSKSYLAKCQWLSWQLGLESKHI